MALNRQTLSTTRPALVLGRVAGYLADLIVWGAVVALLEQIRPHATTDATDLIALGALTFFGFAVARASRAGLLPGTRQAVLALRTSAVRAFRSLAPRYAVAFRHTEGVRPLPDLTLLGFATSAGVALVAFTVGGRWIYTGLALLKAEVSYTLYLIVLAGIWSGLLTLLLLGALAAVDWIRRANALPRSRGVRSPRLALFLGWIAGTVGLSLAPGFVGILLVLGFGLWCYGSLAGQPRTPYLFCRRDAMRRPIAIPVEQLMQRAYLALVLMVSAITAAGLGGHLFVRGWPSGPFAMTHAIGQLAALAGFLLLARAAIHLRNMTGVGIPPEVPITPTIWAEDDRTPSADWREAADRRGFRVHDGPRPPPRGYDLVVTRAANPQRFQPRDGANVEDLGWQLLRRFHVVMRRRFFRRFQRLFKILAGQDKQGGGSGFLFCPHAWMVHGIVRDAETRTGASSIVGPVVLGPTYREVFSPRVRRYLGEILRTQGIDIVYWEDAIRWRDLKRVFGVVFETHDQGRGPIRSRHFVGLPGLRVLVQEEASEPTPTPETPYPTPAAGHVRVLVIVRDRGGEEEEVAPPAPGSRTRLPSLVS